MLDKMRSETELELIYTYILKQIIGVIWKT